MENPKKRHESARNSENDEKSKSPWVFAKKLKKIVKLFFVENICLDLTMS